MTSWDKYADKAARWSERQYADAGAYLARRAELVRTLGPPLAARRHRARSRLRRRRPRATSCREQRYLGVDASAEMVAAGRARGRELVQADLNDYEPPRAGAGDDDLPRDLLRARPARALRADRAATPRRSSSST